MPRRNSTLPKALLAKAEEIHQKQQAVAQDRSADAARRAACEKAQEAHEQAYRDLAYASARDVKKANSGHLKKLIKA